MKLKNLRLNDYILSILASIIQTFSVQLLVYPYLGRIMESDEFGFLLTIMAIINVVGISLGNSLNNTRLLLQADYDKKNLNGDYNPIFLILILVNIALVSTLTIIISKKFDLMTVSYIFISILVMFRAYYTVSFRIVINYKLFLYTSICGGLGYLLGLLITHYTKIWVFAFLFGELFSCVFLIFTARIVRDQFQVTNLFVKSIHKFGFILAAAFISTMTTYMDRFFIYPFLGAEQVSIYLAASILGKMAAIVMNPISGVLLTYYAKESELIVSQFYKRIFLFSSAILILYIILVVIGESIIQLLYPTLVDNAMKYFLIATLGSLIFILGNTIQPTLLRYCNTKWFTLVQSVYLVTYLVSGYFGIQINGLLGFCYAVLIVNIFKIVLMLFIISITLLSQEKLKGVRKVD